MSSIHFYDTDIYNCIFEYIDYNELIDFEKKSIFEDNTEIAIILKQKVEIEKKKKTVISINIDHYFTCGFIIKNSVINKLIENLIKIDEKMMRELLIFFDENESIKIKLQEDCSVSLSECKYEIETFTEENAIGIRYDDYILILQKYNNYYSIYKIFNPEVVYNKYYLNMILLIPDCIYNYISHPENVKNWVNIFSCMMKMKVFDKLKNIYIYIPSNIILLGDYLREFLDKDIIKEYFGSLEKMTITLSGGKQEICKWE